MATIGPPTRYNPDEDAHQLPLVLGVVLRHCVFIDESCVPLSHRSVPAKSRELTTSRSIGYSIVLTPVRRYFNVQLR